METVKEGPYVLPLAASGASLELVGGKGASLARLAAAGLAVPAGFNLTTAAYLHFVKVNDLQAGIESAAASAIAEDPASLEGAAQAIQALFAHGTMPDDIAAAIRRGYAALGDRDVPVAVRSSATAEDLPGASFAGQQETYLNVRGEAALLEAVQRCWASLWTARALGYRLRMAVGHQTVAMGVVVQAMVPADLSGVLFTANPATGERDQILINASFGLGEAIVAGEVTPDSYVVDRTTRAVRQIAVGDKAVMVVPVAGGGTTALSVAAARRHEQALSEPLLRELADLGLRVEQLFGGVPLDIEWAVADGVCWLLQARPITNLPPAPLSEVRWEPPVPGSAWIRRQVVENMPEPLSPLFDELYLREGLDRSVDAIYEVFDMPSDLDRLIDRPLFTTVNGYAYMRGNINFTWSIISVLARSYVTGIPLLFRVAVPYWRDDALPRYLAAIERWNSVNAATASDEQLLQGVRELAWEDARYWFAAAFAIGVAKVSDGLLNGFLATAVPGRGLTSGLFLRGFPSRTLEAEAELDKLAEQIRRSTSLQSLLESASPDRLEETLGQSAEGRAFLDAFADYLHRYGHQIYTLDFVVPTLADDPRAVLLSLKTLSRSAPRDIEARREAMARERDQAVAATAHALDPLRRRVFRLLVGWAQQFGPYREQALFYTGAAWPTLRRLALELGARLTAAGMLAAPDDIFFLESAEIAAASAARAAGKARPDLAGLARERRELREARKRLHAPAAVPPDYRFKLGPFDLSGFETQQRNPDHGAVLRGFAVSPGRMTAPASVIHSPADFEQMQPGSILVCPTTTPAWTPLFSQARGLVTDIGGILAHGSIVAREYGIPAVMGTGNATQRITSGQMLTVDGDAGEVTLSGVLEEDGLDTSRPRPGTDASASGIRRDGMAARFAVLTGVTLAVGVWLWRRRQRSRP